MKSTMFRLLLLQLSDAGLYECAAINVAGNTSRLFRLKVHSAPKVFGPSVDEITKRESTYEFLITTGSNTSSFFSDWRTDRHGL